MTRLVGHFAVWNEWTEIYEGGRFLERISPGAFRKTMVERRDQIRVLLSHGHDAQLGDKPLGPLEQLREDAVGAYYEVPLLDGVPELVVSGLKAGLYGASFRFSTIREEYVARPGFSDHNPDGLPERTLKELKLYELGPTPFPAYQGASASARSSDTVELRALAGREEVLPHGLRSDGSEPATVRRLRAIGSPRARDLLRAIEAGSAVEITWGGRGAALGRVMVRGGARRPRARGYLLGAGAANSRSDWRL